VLGRFGKLSVIFALICSIGVHWLILQTVAWAGMVVSYSLESNVLEGVSKTFDGKHACRLCRVIQAGESGESKAFPKPGSSAGAKADLAMLWPASGFEFVAVGVVTAPEDWSAPSRSESPRPPRPRAIHL
jgi:hypothetical protein